MHSTVHHTVHCTCMLLCEKLILSHILLTDDEMIGCCCCCCSGLHIVSGCGSIGEHMPASAAEPESYTVLDSTIVDHSLQGSHPSEVLSIGIDLAPTRTGFQREYLDFLQLFYSIDAIDAVAIAVADDEMIGCCCCCCCCCRVIKLFLNYWRYISSSSSSSSYKMNQQPPPIIIVVFLVSFLLFYSCVLFSLV